MQPPPPCTFFAREFSRSTLYNLDNNSAWVDAHSQNLRVARCEHVPSSLGFAASVCSCQILPGRTLRESRENNFCLVGAHDVSEKYDLPENDSSSFAHVKLLTRLFDLRRLLMVLFLNQCITQSKYFSHSDQNNLLMTNMWPHTFTTMVSLFLS